MSTPIEPPGRPGTVTASDLRAPVTGADARSSARRVPVATATLLSALWPGLGQWRLGWRRSALLHALPPLVLLVAAVLTFRGLGSELVGAYLLQPPIALSVLALTVALGLWRLASMADAAVLARRPKGDRVGRLGALGMLAATVAVVAIHAYMASFPIAFLRAGESIFGPDPPAVIVVEPSPTPVGASPAPSPLPTDRVTVLFIGIDATPLRVEDPPLSDTILLATFDPQTSRVDMVSIPRDVALFPLYDRPDIAFPNKINMLMTWADERPGRYPEGGVAALVRQVEFLLGIDIDFFASVEVQGFGRMIDAVGGVDIVNEQLIDDPTFQFSADRVGFRLERGPHHLDGELALAYVRSRHGSGNNDYVRARRQQQVLLALRQKLDDPDVLVRLPDVLAVAAESVRTDLPSDQLPPMMDLAKLSEDADIRSVVLTPNRYASPIPPDQVGGQSAIRLDLDAVAELSIRLWGSDSAYARR